MRIPRLQLCNDLGRGLAPARWTDEQAKSDPKSERQETGQLIGNYRIWNIV